MVFVDSEAIAEIDYDAASRTLFVRFVEGDWYRYLEVPAAVHASFLSASSHGRYFHDHILDRYRFTRGR